MLKHQEYTAWVSVDGQPLEVYAVETSLATNEVTCWIASEAGKEFSVHCQNTSAPGVDTIGAFVYIDGQGCHGGLFERWSTDHTINISNAFVSDRITKSLVFSTVRLTDEDEFVDTSSADLGQIQIRVCKVTLGDYYNPSQDRLQTEHKVHERSKKAVTHCVGLGEETIVPQTMLRKSQCIGQPLAVFTFKYRDRNLLKANGVIPTPAPLKRKASQEIIDLTVNDVRVGSNRSNDLVRGEHTSQRTKETERKNKKVKQEQKPGVFVEVIDLT
ncbi:hypothetical protein DEU56DRAFT_907445 [Suillus clintonianus]|uniref:uncharacterized protein n=1 Tax=Suillus clintonianus TaxID=1904413 RepID=UPI001B87D52C|nr:uncharacterized protein DEU56DRAFT_907445 [Suillus clintonianus]KAG2153984.1 hypothetical protein DEU56DRAFT_907445 [Suillus clintonianus]